MPRIIVVSDTRTIEFCDQVRQMESSKGGRPGMSIGGFRGGLSGGGG